MLSGTSPFSFWDFAPSQDCSSSASSARVITPPSSFNPDFVPVVARLGAGGVVNKNEIFRDSTTVVFTHQNSNGPSRLSVRKPGIVAIQNAPPMRAKKQLVASGSTPCGL